MNCLKRNSKRISFSKDWYSSFGCFVIMAPYTAHTTWGGILFRDLFAYGSCLSKEIRQFQYSKIFRNSAICKLSNFLLNFKFDKINFCVEFYKNFDTKIDFVEFKIQQKNSTICKLPNFWISLLKLQRYSWNFPWVGTD